MSLWLTAEELEELTGYKTSRKQKLALGELKIPFNARPRDGFPLVKRCDFESHTVLPKQDRRRKPHLDFLREQ